MNKKFSYLILLAFAFSSSFAQSGKSYQYKVDLTKVVDDRLFVELSTPKVTTSETVFYLPKIVPGTYAIADYGRYVSEFKALDRKGRELPFEKVDVNGWRIKNAQKLSRITYWVEDTFDSKIEGPSVFWPAGTNIESGKNYIINTSGLFGYLEGKKDLSVNFNVIRQKEFYGSTGLMALQTGEPVTTLKREIDPESIDKRVDRYQVENYDRLIDSPLMYSKADTAVIKVANTEVLIGVYSPNSKVTAKEIASTVREVLMAQNEYLGGKLPVNKYAFIFYFTDQPVTSYGALEHSYSSMYYMPEASIGDMEQQLRDFAAHEFFHIVTPLTIHSQEIHKFDFNEPKMSKHLWLYEGMTEYFAGNVQVKYGLITPEKYLAVLRQKMLIADNFIDDVPFTDISKFTLDKYSNQYYNVYQKGALINLCLDIRLRQLSQGRYGVQNLVADLSGKYGKDRAFEDEALFAEIVQLTYPEIGDFFQRYVGGPERLPYVELLDAVGVAYVPERLVEKNTLGFSNSALGFKDVDGKKKLAITSMTGINEQGNAVGLELGDILVKINGEEVPEISKLSKFLARQLQGLQESGKLSYTVLRNDKEGIPQSVELSAPVTKIDVKEKHNLTFDENASQEKLALRQSWLMPK